MIKVEKMSDKSDMDPKFYAKEVFFLDCRNCENTVCRRAMESVLVADSQTKLFSTDCPEKRYQGNILPVIKCLN